MDDFNFVIIIIIILQCKPWTQQFAVFQWSGVLSESKGTCTFYVLLLVLKVLQPLLKVFKKWKKITLVTVWSKAQRAIWTKLAYRGLDSYQFLSVDWNLFYSSGFVPKPQPCWVCCTPCKDKWEQGILTRIKRGPSRNLQPWKFHPQSWKSGSPTSRVRFICHFVHSLSLLAFFL